MQYCPKGPCGPGNRQAFGHVVSKDLTTWAWVAPPALLPNGAGCPNTGGCFTGSTTFVDGVPNILYPGVHNTPAGDIAMSQCVAVPAAPGDPLLTNWTSRVIIPGPPAGLSYRFHDDSQAWKREEDGRWWMFLGGGTEGEGPQTAVAPLYSSQEFVTWRYEHSLFNTTWGGLFSCPEMYALPGMAPSEVLFEALVKGDDVWVGTLNSSSVQFTPYTPDPVSKYDYGAGHASKSMFEGGNGTTGRRILWSWISGKQPPSDSYIGWDDALSVPRVVSWDPALRCISTPPVPELESLRTHTLFSTATKVEAGQPVVLATNTSFRSDVNATFTLPSALPHGMCATAGLRVLASSADGGIVVSVKVCGGAKGTLTVDGSPVGAGVYTAPFPMAESPLGMSLRILVDGSVVETYAQGGRAVVSSRVYVNDTAPTDVTAFFVSQAFMNNTNIQGDEMKQTFPPANGTEADNVAQCVADCGALHGCIAWTYVRLGGGGHTPRCSLKDAVGATQPDYHTVSGVPGAPTTVDLSAEGYAMGDAMVPLQKVLV